MELIDQAAPIRDGEKLDVAAVERFLKDSVPNVAGSLTILQFPSGYSNLTYLLRMGDRELVLRRPPIGTKAKTAHDMGREYRMLKALKPVYPYCPTPLVYTDDPSVTGSPFYVMERLRGIILRKDPPPGLSFTPTQARQLCERLLDVHVELHSVDFSAVGLQDFARPEGYAQRQVVGWSKRYRAARTDDAPDCDQLMAWLEEKTPGDSPRPAIVHNDFRFDNVVLDSANPMNIVGVLDWEMATVGDPLMDLGNSMAYWVQRDDAPELQLMRVVPTTMEGALTRAEMVGRYAVRSGREIENFDFYYSFGLFRLAVIAQQIYYRFYHGQTSDQRFKTLVHSVRILETTAMRVIERSEL
jgi:aminoglycoside phosphotransferase (APT) family kinase protein